MLQSLIVVYKKKDELVVNMLRKLVETNDDVEGKIVGTEDGSVDIIPWGEKMWLENKEAGNIGEKILFIGDIKGTKNLRPIIDIKYKEHGIEYGWAGTQAFLTVDTVASTPEAYQSFYEDFKARFEGTNVVEKINVPNLAKLAKDAGLKTALTVTLPILAPITIAHSIREGVKDSKTFRKVRTQQLLLGVMELYTNHLEQFMKG